MKWEEIDNYTFRAKIHKGWLVKSYEYTEPGARPIVSMCFVPDPMHGWTL